MPRDKHDPSYLDDTSFGIPYFEAIIVDHREYGICPVCTLAVERFPGSFGDHWVFAVAVERTLAGLIDDGLVQVSEDY